MEDVKRVGSVLWQGSTPYKMRMCKDLCQLSSNNARRNQLSEVVSLEGIVSLWRGVQPGRLS